MDLVFNNIESINNVEFNEVVPFPGLEESEQAPSQPTDSPGDSSASTSSWGKMIDSSLSSQTRVSREEMKQTDFNHNASDDKPAAAACRISYQDEIRLIDIEKVPNPYLTIKRILDGLVVELKEAATKDKKFHSPRGQDDTKNDERKEMVERNTLKRASSVIQSNRKPDDDSTQADQEDSSPDTHSKSNALCAIDESHKRSPMQIIMTWMDAYRDSEPIQLICLQSLPSLLEYNTYRYHAQRRGLASIVFNNLASFSNNSLLQLTAFHTLVVLLRPLGAMEGTLIKGKNTTKNIKSCKTDEGRELLHSHICENTMNQDDADKSSLLLWEENGVRLLLDTLRLYSHDRYLQAMGCWAMVNAALYPSLKRSLLKLGGVYVVTNAMMLHPNIEAVQFRGLFALINFVIPDGNTDTAPIHSHVYQIARLTICAMKNFQSNKSILNRGCLVLRNLSLNPSHAAILARTPGCVDMLLHCRRVCPQDVLVQRSARTILILIHRIADKELIHSGVNLAVSSAAESVARTTSDRSMASTPSGEGDARESRKKRSRSSCS